jgi:hypothetical protein
MIIGRHMLARLERGGNDIALATRELFKRHDIETRAEGKTIYAIGLQIKNAA